MTLGPTSGKTGENARRGASARRGRGFHSAAATARKRLGEAAAGHGFAEPEVLLRWPEVVGERLSGLCEPVKVSYSRGQGLGATLVVRSIGARATEVEHLGPQIVERINTFYGYRAITRIKVVQTMAAPAGFAESAPRFAGQPDAAPTTPAPGAEARAAEMTGDIQNEGLRTALTRIGAHVLSRRTPPKD